MSNTRDNRLFEVYTDMLHSMARSTRNPDAAELLFWYVTRDLVAQSKIAEKNDVLGIIMGKFIGSNDGCNGIFRAAEEHDPDYAAFRVRYGLSDQLSELGDHWKEVFWKNRFGQIMILRGWVKMFINECLPAINETIAACENEWKDLPHNMLTEKDLKARQRAYTAYKRKLKALLTKLDTTKELYDLRRLDPDYYGTEE